MEACRLGGMEARRLGGMEAWRLGGMEAWRHGALRGGCIGGIVVWRHCGSVALRQSFWRHGGLETFRLDRFGAWRLGDLSSSKHVLVGICVIYTDMYRAIEEMSFCAMTSTSFAQN